ncbi:MAG: ABC transporter permease [Gammaproteobacteria bacterium]|nr:ABC transporter permease [Gammaproteobacteria bacterium]
MSDHPGRVAGVTGMVSVVPTLLRAQILGYTRDRLSLLFGYVLPIVFFTITVLLFGQIGARSEADGRMLDLLVADRVDSVASRQLLAALSRSGRVKLQNAAPAAGAEALDQAVQSGRIDIGLLVTATEDRLPAVTLVYDSANPVARYTIAGLLQAAASEILLGTGPAAANVGSGNSSGNESPEKTLIPGPLRIIGQDARGLPGDTTAYFAAGVSAMFLLFALSGAGGALLEEKESGVLERLFDSGVRAAQILIAKWLFFTVLGLSQLLVMFVYAALVFQLDLFGSDTFIAFVLVALAAAAAASGFGVLLAPLFHTRGQLAAMSTIVILLMSALGGSMAPRFLMPPAMETVSRFTFNGWALDGFLAVFWYRDPSRAFPDIWLEVGVLWVMALLLLGLAMRLARRWETS